MQTQWGVICAHTALEWKVWSAKYKVLSIKYNIWKNKAISVIAKIMVIQIEWLLWKQYTVEERSTLGQCGAFMTTFSEIKTDSYKNPIRILLYTKARNDSVYADDVCKVARNLVDIWVTQSKYCIYFQILDPVQNSSYISSFTISHPRLNLIG